MAQALKIVLKLDLHDDRIKQKAMKTVSDLEGLDGINVDMKSEKMTLVGILDPVEAVRKLKKKTGLTAKIETVGLAKEPEKPKQPEQIYPAAEYPIHGAPYLYYYRPHPHYYVSSPAEDPNACIIL